MWKQTEESWDAKHVANDDRLPFAANGRSHGVTKDNPFSIVMRKLTLEVFVKRQENTKVCVKDAGHVDAESQTFGVRWSKLQTMR